MRFEKSESVKRELTEVCSNDKFDGLLIEQEKLTSSSTPTEESLCLLQKVTSVFELNADTYTEKAVRWNTGAILAYWREWDAYLFYFFFTAQDRASLLHRVSLLSRILSIGRKSRMPKRYVFTVDFASLFQFFFWWTSMEGERKGAGVWIKKNRNPFIS